jgi:5-oxoprolinase (ATP-hydrolysing)
MPPLSKSLDEEGVAIVAFKLVERGQFQESAIVDILLQKGKFDREGRPVMGTRNLRENLSDLKAQVAANQKGNVLMQDLIREYSLPVVSAYMTFIQVYRRVISFKGATFVSINPCLKGR